MIGNETASADAGTSWLKDLCLVLNIRPLREYGLNPEDFPTILEQSKKANSMKGNPLVLTDTELISILTNAL